MLLDWILALSPLLLILLLMVRYRWGAAKAGTAGLLLAVAVAVTRFGARVDLLGVSHAKAFLLTLDVLLIIWSAFLLYRVADEAGAIRTIGRALPSLTSDRGMQALLIGWAFASFLQGVGGFGVPVAVIAPIMVGLGFSPLMAVVIPSLGHGWSVTFGSLATSFQALMAATGLPGETLAPTAALMLGLAGFATGMMVAHAAAGTAGVRRLLTPILAMALAMGITQFLLATNGLWNIGGLGGGLMGLLTGVAFSRSHHGQRLDAPAAGPTRRELLLALAGYIALVLITLCVQLIPPLRSALGSFVLRMPFPEVRTTLGFTTPAEYGRQIPLLRHAGTILAVSALISYFIYQLAGMYPPGAYRRILGGTVTRVMSASLGIAAMVAMALVMSHAGMTDTLARGLAQGVGGLYPLAAPWIGALGAFMTGSNTNSNVVFALLQMRTSQLLELSAPIILAAQTAGGAIGSVIAPTKVVVGASTAGMAGDEGIVLRALLTYISLLIFGLSILTWLFLRILPT
jgi:lactate permease